MKWIDRQTRAVFVEFSSYNPNINMIMVSSVLVEFLPSGSILSTANFDPLNLFGESLDSVVSFKKLSELFYIGFIVYFMICEIREAIKNGLNEYMRQVLNENINLKFTSKIAIFIMTVLVWQCKKIIFFKVMCDDVRF